VEFKDYYQVMGVARDANEAQIKQAYRKLARKYHPDVSKEKDAEARFKEVGEAYEVLKSPEKRAAYDQLGKNHRPGEDFRPPPDWNAGFEFSGAGPGNSAYSDFFDSLFGAQARSGRRGDFQAGHGEDHHAKVLLDLEASLAGGSRTFTLRMPELDDSGRLVSKERTLNVQIPRELSPASKYDLQARERARWATGNPGIYTSRWTSSSILYIESTDATCRWSCR
jgi:curved DNA-binding protein